MTRTDPIRDGDDFGVVQLRPLGSEVPIIFRAGVTSAKSGSVQADWYADHMVRERAGEELPV